MHVKGYGTIYANKNTFFFKSVPCVYNVNYLINSTNPTGI